MDDYGVGMRLGTLLGDFIEFTDQAGECGIRVLIGLVANHTLIDHSWFQTARSDPDPCTVVFTGGRKPSVRIQTK
jgi:maltose alpha-D-glucosyltransferase/alpha-amylase